MKVTSRDHDRSSSDRDDQNVDAGLSEERREEPTVMVIDSKISDD